MGIVDELNFNHNKVKFIREISYVGDASYLIKMQSMDGEYISSLCKVSIVDTNFPSNRIINFESDEFNKEIMMGFIDVKSLCKLIGFFHDLTSIS